MNRPLIGILEWFRPGEYERVEQVLADLRALDVSRLRTGISWAEWYTAGAKEWYDWLFPRLAREVELLPCFLYTPPSLGVVPRTSSPPRDPKAYADFIDVMITEYGSHFEWLELWNEPNNLSEWDSMLDPMWYTFSTMVGGAAYWAKRRGKKTVLGGMSPTDPSWLALMCERGVIAHIDVLGIHGFPGTWEYTWRGWDANVQALQEVLAHYGEEAEIWITEAGYSTWRHDEVEQLHCLLDALDAPVQRLYWYGAYDLNPGLPSIDGFHMDEREYHFGLKHHDGAAKLLFRLWASGGIQTVQDLNDLAAVSRPRHDEYTLITGGAGFIGSHLADRLLSQGRRVLVYDSLAQHQSEHNLQWLRDRHGDNLSVMVADIRDPYKLQAALDRSQRVYHLAAQVPAALESINPRREFEINAAGTLNLLDALRALDRSVPLVFVSTYHVYGDRARLIRGDTRYEPAHPHLRAHGLTRRYPLDPRGTYACSRGAADQYVLEYARQHTLPAVLLRVSPVYGERQPTHQDQPWLAQMLWSVLEKVPVTIEADPLQLYDFLFIDDLLDALILAQNYAREIGGQALNVGGGPGSALSLLELADLVGSVHGESPSLSFAPRPAAMTRYFVSDNRRFSKLTGWEPQVDLARGLQRVYEWARQMESNPFFELLEEGHAR
jgi:CDP-paratose 2-epimerase